jgi:hypothetical protein
MRRNRSERGEGGLKALILLAVLAYGVFAGVKIMSAKGDDKAIDTKVAEILKFASVNRLRTVDDVRYAISQPLKEYSIPFKADDVTIESEDKEWHVSFAYKREVPLIFWTWQQDVKIDQRGPK